MDDKKIEKLLSQIEIPAPSDAAKRTAINESVFEFEKNIKNTQGIFNSQRLTFKINQLLGNFGSNVMKKSTMIGGSATAIVLVLGIGLMSGQDLTVNGGSMSFAEREKGQFSVIKREGITRFELEGAKRNELAEEKDQASLVIIPPPPTQAFSPQRVRQEAEFDGDFSDLARTIVAKSPMPSSVPALRVAKKEKSKNRLDSLMAEELVGSDDESIGSSRLQKPSRKYNNLVGGAPSDFRLLNAVNDFGSNTVRISKAVPPPALAMPESEQRQYGGLVGKFSADKKHRGGYLGGGVSTGMAIPMELRDNIVRPEPMPIIKQDNDRFKRVERNSNIVTAEKPVSTFSIDVDTASYTFMRKQLNRGVLPKADSVRVEEYINYFNYNYDLPSDKSKPFKPTVAVFQTPWNVDTKLLHIGIKGYDIPKAHKPRSNLVFLLDVSGSMSAPDKLPLLKNGFKMMVENLEPDDTVSIVVYAGAAGTVLEPTKVRNKRKIIEALNNLTAGGSTAGGQGIKLAYDLAQENYDDEAVNRVILATDGDFNVGISNPNELKRFIEKKRKTGVYLSVLGFGQGNYNDHLMQELAQNGNGNASYIDNLSEARKVLVEEANGTLFTIAKDVKIQMEFNPAIVAEYRLIGYETRALKREDFNNDKIDAGEIGAGHSVTALYEITPVGSKARSVDPLRYGKAKQEEIQEPVANGMVNEYGFLKLRYKLPNSNTSTLMNQSITTADEYGSVLQDNEMFVKRAIPQDMRFAAAVAAYAQLLRGDISEDEFSFDDVIALAKGARGNDEFGYRSEFLNMVRLAKSAQR